MWRPLGAPVDEPDRARRDRDPHVSPRRRRGGARAARRGVSCVGRRCTCRSHTPDWVELDDRRSRVRSRLSGGSPSETAALVGCALHWSSGWLKDLAVRGSRAGAGTRRRARHDQGLAEFTRRGGRASGSRSTPATRPARSSSTSGSGSSIERREAVWALEPVSGAAKVSLLRWLRRQLRQPEPLRERLEAAIENDDPAEARRIVARYEFSDGAAPPRRAPARRVGARPTALPAHDLETPGAA